MICILALIVFGILGIFSATHRKIAFEAFDCVFRRLTIRKCTSGLDKRLKSQITGKLMKRSPKIARFAYKNFELISWAFTILLILSIAYSAIGGYNYYIYGNCNGPNDESFCIFDPLGNNNKFSEATVVDASCSIDTTNEKKQLTLHNISTESFPRINRNAENDIVVIGCYACEYTRETYSTIKKLQERNDVNFVFAHLPVKEDAHFVSNILNCINEADDKMFIEFNDKMFLADPMTIKDENGILEIVEEIGMNKEDIMQCSHTERIQNLTQFQISEIQKTGIYGTPTVFINGEGVVGPKPYRVYKRLLK